MKTERDDAPPMRGYKRKTIEKIVRKKMNDWLWSIGHTVREKDGFTVKEVVGDVDLADAVREDYFLTGGALASMLMGEEPNDYDVYLRTPAIAARLAEHYISQLPAANNACVSDISVKSDEGDGRVYIFVRSAGIAGDGSDLSTYRYFEYGPSNGAAFIDDVVAAEDKGRYGVAYMTTNAVTLTDGVQIIIRFVGEPENVHSYFDYAHCTAWFTEEGGLQVPMEALEALRTRELRYQGSLYPVCAMFRMRKFIKRGWSITAGEMLKIAWDISKLDLSDIETLRDQLVGVDSAYFRELLKIMEREGRPVDRSYLVELVERVFG